MSPEMLPRPVPQRVRAAFASTAIGCSVLLLFALLSGCFAVSDHGVAVSSSAFSEYTRTKYQEAAVPRPEGYVVMQGSYHPGAIVDRSLERLDFRKLLGVLAPNLARQRYYPARDLASADLLLVVHWGVTAPTENLERLLARDPPSLANVPGKDANTGVDYHPHTVDSANETSGFADPLVADFFSNLPSEDVRALAFQQSELSTQDLASRYTRESASTLLGYGRYLRQSENRVTMTAEEGTLRADLDTARYFVIIQAYALRELKDRKPRLVWTLHLNMASAGNNFREAVAMMGNVAVNYFGRETSRVDTVLPRDRPGTVTIGNITIVGETN